MNPALSGGAERKRRLPPAFPSDASSLEALRKFIGDPGTPVLFVERTPSEARGLESDAEMSATESGVEEAETGVYAVSTDVHYTSQKAAAVVVIKRGAVVEADKPASQQVRLITMSEGNPYETLHSYVSAAVSPFFKSFIRESAGGGKGGDFRDGDKMAPNVEKKLAELEIGLLHLQQNIDIPEITLNIHHAISDVIKRAAKEGRRPKVEDLGDRIEDSTFLNSLQTGVNRWVREIQKADIPFLPSFGRADWRTGSR